MTVINTLNTYSSNLDNQIDGCDCRYLEKLLTLKAETNLALRNVGGFYSSVTITRPQNTNTYKANASIGDVNNGSVITFNNIGLAGKSILIYKSCLKINIASPNSGMQQFTLLLFNDIPTNYPDNSNNKAYAIPNSDFNKLKTYCSYYVYNNTSNIIYAPGNSVNGGSTDSIYLISNNLYGILITNESYTPGAGDQYVIDLYTALL